jgi:hypothetical protein
MRLGRAFFFGLALEQILFTITHTQLQNVDANSSTSMERRRMRLSRREWIAAGLGVLAPKIVLARALALTDDPAARIAAVIREYEAQGFHRTATQVDRASGDWLADQVRQAGLRPALESFPLTRVDPVSGALVAADRRIEGLPLFDGAFTSPAGIHGRLGLLQSDAEIGLTSTAVNAAASGSLGGARRAARHRAIVAVTEGRRPGLCPNNADSFLRPFGPPVLQASSDDAVWLREHAARGVDAQLIAHVNRTPASASNVVAQLDGTDRRLPPLVVMTPRSGWYSCASERGGGIACWLEIMRALGNPRRAVVFVASSGHELGHLGIDAFIDRRPGIVKDAVGWLHLGANIGAAVDPSITLQASDDQFDATFTSSLAASGLAVTRRTPRGTIPGGEAEAVHRGGGRYVSVIGGNGLFHNPNDRGPEAVDAAVIVRFAAAFAAVARSLADA